MLEIGSEEALAVGGEGDDEAFVHILPVTFRLSGVVLHLECIFKTYVS